MTSLQKASFLLLFLLVASSVHAGNCSVSTDNSKLLIENPRPYNDQGASMTFYAHYLDAANKPITGNNTIVQVSFQNATYNMSYANNKWSVTVSSSNIEDVNFFVNATSDTYACKTVAFTSRWRVPYFVYVDLYKQSLNTTDPARYTNDFQYVVMVNNNGKNADDMTIVAFNNGVNNLFDTTIGWAVGASAKDADVSPPDHNTYFWGAYSNGEAKIKLYEPGNYSVYVMNNKVVYPSNYFWEFERPTTKDVSYLGNVYDKLEVYDHANVTNTPYSYNNTIFKVSLTKFEANSYYMIMNWFWIGIAVVLFIAGLILTIYLAAGSPYGVRIIAAYIVVGLAVLAGVAFAIQ